MNFEDLFYILALQKIEGVGDIVAKKLINHCGSAKEIFSAKSQHLRNIDGIGEVLLKNLKEKSVFQKAESELKFIEKENISVIYFKDKNYPERLKHCIDGPVLLFQSGKIDFETKKTDHPPKQ